MSSYNYLTKHIDAMPSGSHIGAFFDFDGTIIDGYSAFVFIKEQLRKGYIKPFEFVELVSSLVNYSSGMIGFSALMSVGAKILKGVDEDRYIKFSETVCRRHIEKLIYPEARTLIDAHLAKGHTVAVVSSATFHQVEPVLDTLGIKHLYCSSYEVEEGVFTGEILKPLCWNQGKVHAVDDLAKKAKLDVSLSCFYSDSDDDLAVLEYVGFPRVVNPNNRLAEIALEKDWPVQNFARTGKPKALDYLRSVGVYTTLIGSYFGGLGVLKLNGSKEEARRFMLGLFTDVAFASIGVKVKVKGQENIWKQAPAVVVFNHQSQADGLVMMKLLKDNFAAIGKKEIGRFKIFAKAYNFAGIIPIDRENSASAIEAMKPLVRALTVEGRNVVIAPEGTRSETRKPGPFKKGAFHVALQAGVPILPVVIHNAIDIQPKGQFAYRSGTIEVEILPPVDTSTWSKETLDENIAGVRNLFLECLGFDEELFEKAGDAKKIKRKKQTKTPTKKAVVKKATTKKKTTKKKEERRQLDFLKLAEKGSEN